MIYHSTRSRDVRASGREAVLEGLAADGGLFVTDALVEGAELPQSVRIDPASLAGGDYKATARRVLGALLDDFTAEEIAGAVEGAYSGTFSSPLVTPVTALGELRMLELWHGPTAAFKDVALRMLPQLMSRALAGTDRRLMIATATSGDTGKAALEGFRDVPGIGISVFYPEGGVSAVQELQMATQEGANVSVLAVKGDFDAAQSAVKRLFATPEVKAGLAGLGVTLTSANSINIGRLVPQIVYYFDAWRQLLEAGEIGPDEKVDFTVPTGNFGDVLAGWCARRMGLPVGRLIVASNANDVLTRFLSTGVYDRRRTLEKTISPSMDILVSSNLERCLFWMDGGDAERSAARMRELAEKGFYRIPEALLARLQAEFGYGMADDDVTRASIREAWEKEGRLIDPHTAVARRVALENLTPGRKMIVLSTASPYKFCAAVYEALYGRDEALFADPFAVMDALCRRTGVEPPAPLAGLRGKAVRWRETGEVAAIPEFVLRAARERLGA